MAIYSYKTEELLDFTDPLVIKKYKERDSYYRIFDSKLIEGQRFERELCQKSLML